MESASKALLDLVLITAGLLEPEPEPASNAEDESSFSITRENAAPIKLIDIGFGCGDQMHVFDSITPILVTIQIPAL